LRLDHGVRDLSLRLFKQNFFPVYVLSQLEIERLKYSIAIDRTEADRTKSWSGIYHPVGKLRKPMIAYNTWTNGSANQPTLLDPSPFTAGSNSHTTNVWGASYDRQRKDMAILAQLVLNLTFESIDDMESFRLDLRADISSAIGCSVDAVQVHSVVAGSVVATISLLSDTNPTHGDRSPSDLMKELVKQSVDSSSSLRSGKYTMHMTELKQVPNSIADQSVQDQELRAASISDVLQRIENQSGPLWDAMRQAKSAVTICAGTDKEVIVIRDGDSQVCIPSYRLRSATKDSSTRAGSIGTLISWSDIWSQPKSKCVPPVLPAKRSLWNTKMRQSQASVLRTLSTGNVPHSQKSVRSPTKRTVNTNVLLRR
jgi:hypothetical protein